jgi:mannose-6-phosphate isomerase
LNESGIARLFPRFPLLVKIIDAREILSVQVHPNDIYAAAQNSADTGKSEMWYIIKPPDSGKLIIGLRDGVTRSDFAHAIETGRVEDCLNYLPVKETDMINIPAGLLHALTPGTILAEIQQNSDTTYRVYDYGRVGVDGLPRPLHIQDALNVIDFEGKIPRNAVTAVKSEFFNVEKWEFAAEAGHSTHGTAFIIKTCVSGAVKIKSHNGEVLLHAQQSAFLPGEMGEYTLHAEASGTSVLHSTVPHPAAARS